MAPVRLIEFGGPAPRGDDGDFRSGTTSRPGIRRRLRTAAPAGCAGTPMSGAARAATEAGKSGRARLVQSARQCGSAATTGFSRRVTTNASGCGRSIRSRGPRLGALRTGVLVAAFRCDAPARCARSPMSGASLRRRGAACGREALVQPRWGPGCAHTTPFGRVAARRVNASALR